MNKGTFCLIILLAILSVTGCSKKDNNSNNEPLSEKSDAKAIYDNSNYGIYKGVFIGSSGNVMININNDNTLSAKLKIDGINYDFTSSQTIQQNQPSSINFVNGSNSFTFSVDANGANPTVSNISIAGHPNALVAVAKESSQSVIRCYEGTYTGSDEGGVFNLAVEYTILLPRGLITGNARQTTAAFQGQAPGTWPFTYSGLGYSDASNPNSITFSVTPVPNPSGFIAVCTGTISGYQGLNISGTISSMYGTGSWRGTRTL